MSRSILPLRRLSALFASTVCALPLGAARAADAPPAQPIPHEMPMPNQPPPDFPTAKTRVLGYIDAQVERLQHFRGCVEAAANEQALDTCRQRISGAMHPMMTAPRDHGGMPPPPAPTPAQ